MKYEYDRRGYTFEYRKTMALFRAKYLSLITQKLVVVKLKVPNLNTHTHAFSEN